MDLGDFGSSLKVLVLGGPAVGKSSLSSTFCRDDGSYPAAHRKTIGTEFKEKNLYVEDTCEDVNLMLWEVGGEHIDAPMAGRCFAEAGAVVLMFASDDRASFDLVRTLHRKVRAESGPDTVLVLVQHKMDLFHATDGGDPGVSIREGEDLARELCLKLYRTSCTDKAVVDQVFDFLVARTALTGTQAALADIGDVNPIIGPSSSTGPGSSAGASASATASASVTAGEGSSAIVLDGVVEESKEGDDAGAADPAPKEEHAKPTKLVPSKQRTLGRRKRSSCALM